MAEFDKSKYASHPGLKPLEEVDPDMFELIEQEKLRQFSSIELIASENFTSNAVMECLGSCLTNKYSEGLPDKRYYGGNEIIDQVRQSSERGERRALWALFKIAARSVPPRHCGAPATSCARGLPSTDNLAPNHPDARYAATLYLVFGLGGHTPPCRSSSPVLINPSPRPRRAVARRAPSSRRRVLPSPPRRADGSAGREPLP